MPATGPYPKWMYSSSLPPIIVGDATAETTAIAQGYTDAEPASPASEPDFDVATYNPPAQL